MSSDFSNLKKLSISRDSTSRFVLSDLEGAPVLIVRPATEENGGYFEAVASQTTKTLRRLRSGAGAKMLKENRKLDRGLYPVHIITTWENVCDTEGAEVDYSREDCKAFIQALPGWIFDKLRNFCGEQANFLPEEDEPDGDALGEA